MSTTAKVLVTGASGYIAGHVVKLLLESGYVVRGTVRSLKNTEKVTHLYDVCPGAQNCLELVEADLLHEESWQPAVQGMDYVIHMASPMVHGELKDEDKVIKSAVEGTLSVLRACAKVPSVKRVVLTSSCVAVGWHLDMSKSLPTEADWSDITKLQTYGKSKVLSERAAWDFVKDLPGVPDGNKFELAVINPTLVVGPSLQRVQSTCNAAIEVLQKLLERQLPLLPQVSFSVIDVRDVALAHVQALAIPEAAGHRHLCTSSSLWLSDLAILLKSVFGKQGYNVPTSVLPMWLLRVFSLFDKSIRDGLPDIGTVHQFSNRRMRQVLKVEPRDVRNSFIEMAYSLIEAGLVKKTRQYRGPGGPEERLSLKLST